MPRAEYMDQDVDEILMISKNLHIANAQLMAVLADVGEKPISLHVKNAKTALKLSESIRTYAQNVADAWIEHRVGGDGPRS